VASKKLKEILLGGGDLASLVDTSKISSGVGAPLNSSGQDGDVYIRVGGANSDIYIKKAGIWQTLLGGTGDTLVGSSKIDGVPTWRSASLDYTLFNSSATNIEKVLGSEISGYTGSGAELSLTAGEVIQGMVLAPVDQFLSSGAMTDLLISVGVPSNDNKYVVPYSVFGAPSVTNFITVNQLDLESTKKYMDLQIKAQSVGDTLDTLTQGNLIVKLLTSKLDGTPGFLGQPSWKKYVYDHIDMAVPSTSTTLQIPVGAKTAVTGLVIKHNTAFTGGALSAVTVKVGVPGDLDKYATPFDIYQAPSSTLHESVYLLDVPAYAFGTTVELTVEATGANLNALTQGDLEVWLQTSIFDEDNLSMSNQLTWFKYTVDAAAFTASATSQTLELFDAGSPDFIHGFVVKHNTPFSGGSITDFTVEIGIDGDENKYTTAFDVFQPVSDTAFQPTSILWLEKFGGKTRVRITGRSTGGDVVDATQGSVDVYVLRSRIE
jgi:hypothetical protein